ncbi:hypothetical protein WI58_29745 [Burkholderia cepacia]|uniref:hypothetical protein n=1 Tax=Burkholderia cepacia TaxID=292 RepID=UPI00075ECFE2|nr:hypothetical protein [Burkholderia cepacia]KVA92186.1 hypothetical protein WI50_05155 [Burkholderia cepacia]KVA96256.1 hypothetical protein WI51_35760 [Burkholderia cepacia]KVB39534.1 hypothetical protein WI57_33420 [Burkholderia cepacia]KVB41197.1 hypothetical protein WI58_29745 [Burkholderia cepacia]KVB54843.1 hypothetical protein WI60_16295 [Burkholderia cepacia]
MTGLRVMAARRPAAIREPMRLHVRPVNGPAPGRSAAFESVHHANRIWRFLAKLSLTFVEMTQ